MPRWQKWLPFAVFLIGVWIAFHPVILSGFRAMPRDPGDSRLINYILEHSYLWLTQAPGHTRFWDWPAFYPAAGMASSTDLLLGVAPPYWLARAVGIGPEPALQVWILVMCALNFVAARALCRVALGVDERAASVGAFLFAFGLPRITALWHPQLLPEFYSVIVILAIVKTVGTPGRTRWSAVWLPALTLEFLSSVYLAWFLALALVVAAVVAGCHAGLRRDLFAAVRRNRGWMAASALASVALVAPLAAYVVTHPQEHPVWGYDQIFWFLPGPQAWLNVGPEHWLYGRIGALPFFHHMPNEPEKRLGLGFVTPLVIAWALWRERQRLSQSRLLLVTALPAAVLMAVITVFPRSVSLWQWLYGVVPGGGAIRAVSRIGIFLLIPASILVARALGDLARRGRSRLAWILAALVILEQGQTISTYDWTAAHAKVQAIAASIPRTCSAFFYSPAPIPESSTSALPQTAWRVNLDAMWASIDAGIPTINGYSSQPPVGWRLDPPIVTSREDETRLSRALQAWLSANGRTLPDGCWAR